jgi:hypothetical protein
VLAKDPVQKKRIDVSHRALKPNGSGQELSISFRTAATDLFPVPSSDRLAPGPDAPQDQHHRSCCSPRPEHSLHAYPLTHDSERLREIIDFTRVLLASVAARQKLGVQRR